MIPLRRSNDGEMKGISRAFHSSNHPKEILVYPERPRANLAASANRRIRWGGTRQADLPKPVRQLDSRAAEFDRGIEGFQIPTLSSQIARPFNHCETRSFGAVCHVRVIRITRCTLATSPRTTGDLNKPLRPSRVGKGIRG